MGGGNFFVFCLGFAATAVYSLKTYISHLKSLICSRAAEGIFKSLDRLFSMLKLSCLLQIFTWTPLTIRKYPLNILWLVNSFISVNQLQDFILKFRPYQVFWAILWNMNIIFCLNHVLLNFVVRIFLRTNDCEISPMYEKKSVLKDNISYILK